ncbi:hypothetical protein M8C13_04625 [Crossiella sp. SN42]|uniref:hypothetical protein n=1 Tax=Crossiella sp. SN42 TaxID=2944808 RepID=UPI00207CD5C4|nr:hypothetical protein [Crossiella sp. SN42]MCO1575044.1 hypothetical protein [Crossiella sp. SN42]
MTSPSRAHPALEARDLVRRFRAVPQPLGVLAAAAGMQPHKVRRAVLAAGVPLRPRGNGRWRRTVTWQPDPDQREEP